MWRHERADQYRVVALFDEQVRERLAGVRERGKLGRYALSDLYDERCTADAQRPCVRVRRGAQHRFARRGAARPVGVAGRETADRVVVHTDPPG